MTVVSDDGRVQLAALEGLTPTHLSSLAAALEGGTLAPPYTVPAVRRVVPDARASALVDMLTHLHGCGIPPAHVAFLARAVAIERDRATRVADRVALVWTGPEVSASETRDTSVVVRELFERARRSVLVTGYVVYGGKTVFEPLAARMDAVPELDARVFLNVARQDDDMRDAQNVLHDFAQRFAMEHWPGERRPRIFHDPRSLVLEQKERAVLHAKCVVVDDEVAFVTSANLTGAAQYRNVEAGVLIEDAQFARRLRTQFDVLVEHRYLQAVPWPVA